MKNVLPSTKIVAIQNYLLCELLSNRYISTQSTVEVGVPGFIDMVYIHSGSL